METRAISVKDAEAYLKAHDRAYKEPAEAICAIAVGEPNPITTELNPFEFNLHGAAILGRMDNETAALVHIYVDGASQGYSLLYGACWRALKALGYKRAVL